MATIYISIGSNINPAFHVCESIKLLRESYGKIIQSTVYESTAVGFEGDNFYNLVVSAQTNAKVEAVAQTLRFIEDHYGRDRGEAKFSPRTLDLDLLLYDDLICHYAQLELPRAEILSNAYVLWPLSEIAPLLKHPLNGSSMLSLWDEFDKTSQQLWPIALNC